VKGKDQGEQAPRRVMVEIDLALEALPQQLGRFVVQAALSCLKVEHSAECYALGNSGADLYQRVREHLMKRLWSTPRASPRTGAGLSEKTMQTP
jgi:hypothetical protein